MARPPFQAPHLPPFPKPITGDDGFEPRDLDSYFIREGNMLGEDANSVIVDDEHNPVGVAMTE